MRNIVYSVLAIIILFFSFSSLAFAQELYEVHGIVSDDKSQPLVGVSIVIKGTKTGVFSDINGEYKIKVRKAQYLVFSAIGMQTKTIKVESRVLNVILNEDNEALNQVVVTGYQKVKNRVYTGAASSVKLEDIKMEGISDVSRMLEGRVAGLSIQNISGSFGAAPRINIRGGASIIGNVQPLWVIDGAVYEDLVPISMDELSSGDAVTLISSAVAGLNPSDIQDIQVLKDASATSIYGARALNGVIVVSTKSGRRNAPIQINYSSEYSFRQKPSYRDFDLLNSQETMSILLEMQAKGHFGLNEALYGRHSGVFYQYYKSLATYNPENNSFVLNNNLADKKDFFRKREYANTDWFDKLFTFKPIVSHTISFTGGSKNMANRASISYYTDSGWTVADAVQRLTANLKSTIFFNKDVSATFTAQGNIRKQKAPGTIDQKKNTSIGSFERDFDINPFAYALSTSRTLRDRDEKGALEYYRNNWADFNIFNEYANNYMDINVLDMKLQAEFDAKLHKDLDFKALLSVRSASTSIAHSIMEKSNIVQAFRANDNPKVGEDNIYLLHDRQSNYVLSEIALSNGGIFNKKSNYLSSYLARLSLDYNRSFYKHELKSFAFTELRLSNRNIDNFSGYGIQYDRANQVYGNPLMFKKLFDEGETYFAVNERYERGLTFAWANTYSYAERYILNAVINIEGSNMAGKSRRARWLPTWNIGAKWNIDNEAFMKDYPIFSKLDIRASYGLIAKMNEQALNANAIFTGQIINRLDVKDRENSLKIFNLENKDLTWEKMYELNFGLDFGLWNNRINASIDVYRRNSFDLIDIIRTSGIGGEYYKYANFGDMRSVGLEFALNSKNLEFSGFSWSSTLSFSIKNQKITRLLNNPNTFDMVAGRGRGNIKDYPKSSLFSFNFQALSSQGLPTFDFGKYPNNNEPYRESVGADFEDAQYSKSYLIYHGPIEPNIISGLSNTLRYKNWEFSFFITMQAGNSIRLNPSYDPQFADLNVFNKDYYKRWLVVGDEYSTDVPVLVSRDLIRQVGRENIERAYNTYNYSQYRVADGSFVRMKNISLAYRFDLSKSVFKYISSALLRINITNPFLIYSDSRLNGQDPEFYRAGGVSLPTPKQYTMSLNLSF